MPAVKAVLFDLDGTLLDTAPDLADALNIQLTRHGKSALPFLAIRAKASHGSKALVQLGFNINEQHTDFARLRQEFFDIYQQISGQRTQLFPGMQTVLAELEQQQIPWGIVTNKPGWLTMPLLAHLNLATQAACIVAGDTLSVAKPDPAPLLHACRLLHHSPNDCIFIGDAEVDVIAGNRAAIKTYLAGYGYLNPEDKIATWQVTRIISSATEILEIIN